MQFGKERKDSHWDERGVCRIYAIWILYTHPSLSMGEGLIHVTQKNHVHRNTSHWIKGRRWAHKEMTL